MTSSNEVFDDFLAKIDAQLPDVCVPGDLVKTGLVSHALLSQMRRRGSALPFIKIEGKILYIKKDFMAWLAQARHLQAFSRKKPQAKSNETQLDLFERE
jgi:hypothetical protein